jgi:hypothetical protein
MLLDVDQRRLASSNTRKKRPAFNPFVRGVKRF